MPLRGESVGSAYVRIYADGSQVPEGIRKSLEDAEPSVRRAGADHGELYGEEFDRTWRKHFVTTHGEMFEDLNDSLTNAIERLDLADGYFKSKEWHDFTDRLDKEFGLAGRRAGQSLEQEFRDSTNLDGLADQMRNIGPKVRTAQRELLEELHTDALRMNADFDRRMKDQIRDLDAAFERGVRDNEMTVGRLEDAFKRVGEEIDKIKRGEKSVSSASELRRFLDDLDRQMRHLDSGLVDGGKHLREWGYELRLRERELARLTPTMSRFNRRIDEGSGIIARLFGKGSRNNFLNFFGSAVGGMLQVIGVVPRTIGWFQRLGGVMSTTFNEVLRDTGSNWRAFSAAFAEGGSAIAQALASIVAGGAAFAALLGLLVLVIGPVVGLLSGLVGIVTALSASIVFGLVGAVAALLPLLIPLAGIVGGIALAMKKLKDGSGPLGKTLDELKNHAKNWVDAFKEPAFKNLDRYVSRIEDAASGFRPLFHEAGIGFNRFLNQMTQGMNSPAFDHFFKRFAQFLPHAMKDLGDIASNTFGIIGGLLTDMIPSANRLLTWLSDITGQFDAWVNSREGRREVKDFLDKAGDSAAAVGDFLESATKWLGKLLLKGQGTGDTIFGNMADDFDRWSKWLDDHPHAVEDWFGNAESLSHDIGDLVDNLNHLIDTLDDGENRVAGNSLIKALTFALEFLTTDATVTETALSATWGFLKNFASWLGWFFGTLGSGLWWFFGGQWAGALVNGLVAGIKGGAKVVGQAFSALWDGVKSLGSTGGHGLGPEMIDTSGLTRAVTSALGTLSRLPGGASKIAGQVGHAFSGVGGDIRGFISGIPGIVSGIFNKLPPSAQSAVKGIIKWFSGIAAAIGPLASGAVTVVAAWFAGLPGRLASIPGQIVSLFSGLAGKILSAIGSIDIYPHIHMPHIPGTAVGGMFDRPQLRLIGEAGPEAVVPLRRPLSQVDPAVRALSAFAQGMDTGTHATSSSKTIDASGWQIITPSEDPRIVATETLDALVAALL